MALPRGPGSVSGLGHCPRPSSARHLRMGLLGEAPAPLRPGRRWLKLLLHGRQGTVARHFQASSLRQKDTELTLVLN